MNSRAKSEIGPGGFTDGMMLHQISGGHPSNCTSATCRAERKASAAVLEDDRAADRTASRHQPLHKLARFFATPRGCRIKGSP
jgi:hypothetical protein